MDDPILGILRAVGLVVDACLWEFSEQNGFYRYIFSELWDPERFTGINFCDFHANMQIQAPLHACAQ